MDEVVFSGIRAFRDRVTVPLRPLTLLVGENSTGKSTVLAMIRAAWDVARQPRPPDFTEEPFDLGAYDSIAHFHGGRGARVDHFTLGASFIAGRSRFHMEASFRQHDGQPEMFRWHLRDASNSVTAQIDEDGKPSAQATVAGKDVPIGLGDTRPLRSVPREQALRGAMFMLEQSAFGQPGGSAPGTSARALVPLLSLSWDGSGREPRPHAGAPIRSEPERTYNAKRSVQVPAGAHVPMALASMSRTSKGDFKALVAELTAFGEASGLYRDIDVKQLGKKVSDPFQVLVGVEKFAFNLTDVGYGVSQVLPILFDSLSEVGPRTFLLQQPEVHLHPRAQAALGSFFVHRAMKATQRFVVETHSDYLVDRVRTEVRKKGSGLRPDDVALLFFERWGGVVRMHPMTLDEEGNIVDAPRGYRTFFLHEEREVLGIGA